MSRCVSPTLPSASEMTGSNISTSLRAGSLGVSNVAHETIATSRSYVRVIFRGPRGIVSEASDFVGFSYVVLVVVVRRIRLTGRPEVLDVAEVGLALALLDPDRLDPHAEPDFVRLALLDEEHGRDVSTVQPDPGRHVRRHEAGAGDARDAERRDRALAGERQLLVGGDAAHRAGAAWRDVHLLAARAALA